MSNKKLQSNIKKDSYKYSLSSDGEIITGKDKDKSLWLRELDLEIATELPVSKQVENKYWVNLKYKSFDDYKVFLAKLWFKECCGAGGNKAYYKVFYSREELEEFKKDIEYKCEEKPHSLVFVEGCHLSLKYLTNIVYYGFIED